jgi:two-component system response regulator DesR
VTGTRGRAGDRSDLIAAAPETGTSPLTAREAYVLREAESGLPTDQIAFAYGCPARREAGRL